MPDDATAANDLTQPAPTSGSLLLARLLQGEAIPDAELSSLNPRWRALAEAAQSTIPEAREDAQFLLRSGQATLDRLLATLRAGLPQYAPWPEPTPFGRPTLPPFPT